jgi:hypothetical protein
MKYRNLILAITPISSVAMAQISAANAGVNEFQTQKKAPAIASLRAFPSAAGYIRRSADHELTVGRHAITEAADLHNDLGVLGEPERLTNSRRNTTAPTQPPPPTSDRAVEIASSTSE